MKYFAQGILLALIALLPMSAFADQLEVTFPPPPALDVNGLPAQVLSWDVYVNGALREEGVPLSVASRTYEITEFRQYSVQVAAINSVGVGALSAAATVDYNEPRGVPSRSGAPGVRILMIGGGGGGGEPPVEPPSGDNAARIAALMTGHTVTFPYSTPFDPVTTSVFNVPADGSFTSAVSVSGRQVIVADGYTGAGRSGGWGNDIDIVMSNTATITSQVDFGNAQRIRWTGGNIFTSVSGGAGGLNGNGFTDILIDNLNVETTGSGTATNWAVTQQRFQRLALINSTFIGGENWGIFVRPVVNPYTGGANHNDMIVANCITRSNQLQAARIMSVDNLVIVDSIGLNGTPGQSGWRIHYLSTNVYGKNVIGRGLFLISPNGGAPNDGEVINGYFDNWHNYNLISQSQAWANHNAAQNTGTVVNSKVHWEGGAGSIAGISPFIDGGGNSRVAWDTSTIDYSEMPGKSSLADYGADH